MLSGGIYCFCGFLFCFSMAGPKTLFCTYKSGLHCHIRNPPAEVLNGSKVNLKRHQLVPSVCGYPTPRKIGPLRSGCVFSGRWLIFLGYQMRAQTEPGGSGLLCALALDTQAVPALLCTSGCAALAVGDDGACVTLR